MTDREAAGLDSTGPGLAENGVTGGVRPGEGPAIRPFAPGDLAEVVALVAEAFLPSELYAFVGGGDEAERLRFLRSIFGYRVALGTSYGQTDVAVEGGRIVGAAVWTPPATCADGHRAAAEFLETRGPMTGALEGFPETTAGRWTGFFDLFLAARDAVVAQPFWSLTPVAVVPDRQGRKVASRLLRPRFDLMDREGLPCFLGSQDARSRDVYLGYGFNVVRSDRVPGSDIVSWSMIRRPRKLRPPREATGRAAGVDFG